MRTTDRTLRRSLLLLVSLLLLAFTAAPAVAETGSPTAPSSSPASAPDQNQVTLASGATARLQATQEAVMVELSTGERFTAANPYKSAVESKLEVLESKVGEHLVAQVIAGDKIHVWILMPQDGTLKLGGEIANVQTVRLAGDLIMVGYVIPIKDGRTSVASSIYRYSSATGNYEKTATPASSGGGPSYPVPPSLQAQDEPGHESTPSGLGSLTPALWAGLLGLTGLALAGTIAWLFVSRRRGPKRGEAGGVGPAVALSEQDLVELAALGLANPVDELLRSLESRADLIPLPASPGGTMRFVRNDRWVITRRWVVAPFHDGKRGGRLLLRYRPLGGTVDWTVLDVESD